ncbi:uncharacterized protein LOC124927719 [Impatiens glandulifera]|uniref:uncharacterized protein LOC124927719 n=1 Tax=Impatiens glandulifera TaxID=253017 RepID=UPI001FB0B39C|nr:uncharacterized protein LOC124927719 [Impatiens glandulifera]
MIQHLFFNIFCFIQKMNQRRRNRSNLEDSSGKPNSDTEEHKPHLVDDNALLKSGALPTIEETGERSSLDYYTQFLNQQIEDQKQKISNQLHHHTTSEDSHNVYSCYPSAGQCLVETPPPSSYDNVDDIQKIGMDAVNRALSLLKSSQAFDSSSVKNKAKSEEMGKKSGSETELSSVLNAWYLAGFHTGKYLEEQAQLKRGGQ